MQIQHQNINILLLGDSSADKGSLVCAYMESFFPNQHRSCKFFEHSINTSINGFPIIMNIWDLAGEECYDNLRHLAYKQIRFDVFLVCFSVVKPRSAENVRNVWIPEIRWKSPKTPIIIVGTQVELRTDKETYERLESECQSPVTSSIGNKLAKRVRAHTYLECSAMRRQGLRELFEVAIRAAFSGKRQKTGQTDTCSIH